MKSAIGLDIGSHSIKAVELYASGTGFEIVNYVVEPLPKSLIIDRNNTRQLSDFVKDLFSSAGFKSKKVYLTVSGNQVAIRQVTLPNMPEEDIIDAIRWNTREDVLFSVDDACIDYYYTGQKEEDGTLLNEYLAVLAQNDLVTYHVNVVKEAGLKPMGVSVIPMALWHYDQVLFDLDPDIVTAYVDMGAERTRVYFISNNKLLFSREIPNGGQNVSRAMLGNYETEDGVETIDSVRAEHIKKAYGLPGEDTEAVTEEGVYLTDIRNRILPVLNKQAEEIFRSYEYFKNHYKVDEVDRVIISGGSASLRGLYNFLKENLGLEVERCNVLMQCASPLEGVGQEDVKRWGPSLTVASGTALGQSEKINILPEEYRTSLKKNLIKMIPGTCVLILIGILFLISSGLRGENESTQQQIRQAKQELAQKQALAIASKSPVQKLQSLRRLKSQLENERATLPGAPEKTVNLKEVLKELARIVPINTSLSTVAYFSDRGQPSSTLGAPIRIEGHVFGDEKAVLRSLTRMMDRLKSSSVFGQVKLVNSEAMDAEVYTKAGIVFEIQVRPLLQSPVSS